MKILSVFTLVCFILTNVLGSAFANTSVLFPYKNTTNDISNIVSNQNLFSQYAKITDSIYKEKTPLVIVINDLHNNPQAQQNIEQIINFISQNSNLNKIILEGAPNKQVSTKLFTSIKDNKAINFIADNMLLEGELSGAESFVIKNDFESLYGLENWDIYLQNIKRNLVLKNKYIKEIDILQKSYLENRIYFNKPQLFYLFSQEVEIDKRIIEIYNFCKNKNIDLSMYSQITKFVAIKKFKNNKDINKEFTNLLNDIKQKVSFKTYQYITNIFKQININAQEKLNLIFYIVKNYSPDLLLKYNLLLSYCNCLEKQISINKYSLIQELYSLENFLLDNIVSYNQKEIILVDKFIYLLSEYTNLSLSYFQYQYFKQNKNYLYKNSIKYLDTNSLKIINNILKDKDLENYYLVNDKRNEIFYNNVSNIININNDIKIKPTKKNIIENLKNIDSVNIVVVGGFHNKFIDMLKQNNVSVLSVVPIVNEVSNLDNKIIRVENVVYKNALISPSAFYQLDINDIATIVYNWQVSMDKENISKQIQQQVIKEWIQDNNIDIELSFEQKEIKLNGVFIKDILKSKYIKENINDSNKNKFNNFVWILKTFFAKVKTPIVTSLKKIKNLFKKINAISNLSSNSSEYVSKKLLNERIINNEYQRTLDSLNQKMPDIILIAVSSKQDKDFCDEILTDIKNHPNFKNTKIQYVFKDKQGTAVGFSQAIRYLNFIDLGKQFKDLTSVIIDIDTNEKEIIGRKDLPMQFNGRNITPLELAVLNGIRNTHKFKNGGGISVIDPQSIYIGNMLATGDITFISSAVNMKEIQNHKHSLVIKDYPDKLRQLYYGFQPQNISDIVEKKGIEHKNFYNFDNELMRQFEVVTGNVLISFDTEEKYESFFNFISDIANYLGDSPKKTNLYQHILIPLLRLNNKSKIESFFAKTMEEMSYKDREFFNGLAEKINKYYLGNKTNQEIKFGVYHQSKSLYSRNYTAQLFNKLKSIFKSTQIQTISNNTKSKIKQKQVVIKETFGEDTAIARAYELLSQIQDKQFNSSIDYEQVYEIIIEIFRTTSIQQEIYTVENINAAKLYRYISEIISNTIAQINEEKVLKTNKIEQTYLDNLKTSFLSMQHYTIEYLRFLDYATNMSTLGSYIFPKNSFFEKSKLMPINRAIFGFSRGINKAKRNLREQLATVYSSGNFLIDSLYSYSVLRNDIETFISNTENPKQKTSVGMQKQWGNRRAIQRFLSLAIALQSFVTTVISAIVSSSFNMITVTTAIVSLTTGVGLSVFLHRGLIFVGWNNQFYNRKKKEIENELKGQNSVKDSIEFFVYDKDKISKLEKIFDNIFFYSQLPQEGKKLVKETMLLLQKYKQNYDLKLISTILKNSKLIYKQLNNSENLKSSLEEFINYLDRINIEDEPQYYYSIGKGFVSDAEKTNKEIEKYLTNWLNIIKTKEINKITIDNIIKNANEIIEITSFNKSKFKGANKDILISQLQDFISFSNLTINLYLQLSSQEQEELKPEIEILEKMYDYALQYYKALNYLVSLDILYGYRISKGNRLYFLEKLGMMSVIRVVYGIHAGIFLSKKGFIKSINEVKNIGNKIVNGLYNDKFDKEIENYFKEKEKPNYFYLGITESWKDRKMLTRFLPLTIFLEKVVKGIVVGTFSFKSTILSFVTGVGLTITLHWIPILSGVFKTSFINKEKNILEKGKNSVEQNRQLLLQKHIDYLSNVPYGQMPDLIVIVGTQNKYTISELNNSIRNIRKYGNLQSVPVEPIITRNNGNGNTLLDVFSFIQSKQFVKDYPTLLQKNLEDLKIVVINVDGAESSIMNKQLDIEIVGKTTTSIELSLLNAIGMIQQNNNDSGNIVIADPSYMYLGNLTQTDNITLLSPNVTYEQLKNQNLPLLISDLTDISQDGSSKIQKLYSTFDDTRISNIAVLHMFNQMYDTENSSIMQMPTYSGIVGMKFNNKQEFETLLKFMNIAKEYEENYQGRKFKIDFVQHLIIPLIRLMNNENLFVYLESLKAPISNLKSQVKYNYDTFFYGLFSKFNEEFKGKISNSFVNVSSTQNSIVTKAIKENFFYKNFISLLNSLKQFNVTQTIKKITDNITNIGVSKKKFGLLIVQQLSSFSKHQIFAFDNEETNNIAITDFSQLSNNKKDSGVIINVPIENTIIPTKIFYDTVEDKKGKNHLVVGFYPVLFDDIDIYSSVKEIDILNSVILSTDKTKIDEIRTKLFLGRATLAFIQELKTNKQLDFIFEDSDFVISKIDPSYIVSFDDSGLFSVSDIVNDRFTTDKEMKKIKHINISTTNKDLVQITQDYLSELQISNNIVEKYNISSDGKINLSLLFRLISNYNFSFYELDFSTFLSNPKQYAQNLLSKVFDTKIVQKDFSNISIVPTIDIKYFSISKLKDFLQNIKINKLTLKNIFVSGTHLFDISSLNISYEIDRLNNSSLDKLKNILDDTNYLNSNKFFVLNNLLKYVKSNKIEYNLFQQFISIQTIEFVRDLNFEVAKQISGKKIISENKIEEIKESNIEKWNYYFELYMYMQYISYNYYQDITNLLKSSNTQLVIDCDLENVSLPKIVEHINYLYTIYGISSFKINKIYTYESQKYVMNFLRTNISNDILLIFDDITENINSYQNTICISDESIQKYSFAIKPNLSTIESVDTYLADLSKQEKLTTIFINITDILNDLSSVEKFYQIVSLLKDSDSFDYLDYGKKLVEKYRENIIFDTSNKQIEFINISEIDVMNVDNCFNIVYKILFDAKISVSSYENLLELLEQLYMQYKYSNKENREKIVLELKGILLNISSMQQLADISILDTEINTENINTLLACA